VVCSSGTLKQKKIEITPTHVYIESLGRFRRKIAFDENVMNAIADIPAEDIVTVGKHAVHAHDSSGQQELEAGVPVEDIAKSGKDSKHIIESILQSHKKHKIWGTKISY